MRSEHSSFIRKNSNCNNLSGRVLRFLRGFTDPQANPMTASVRFQSVEGADPDWLASQV